MAGFKRSSRTHSPPSPPGLQSSHLTLKQDRWSTLYTGWTRNILDQEHQEVLRVERGTLMKGVYLSESGHTYEKVRFPAPFPSSFPRMLAARLAHFIPSPAPRQEIGEFFYKHQATYRCKRTHYGGSHQEISVPHGSYSGVQQRTPPPCRKGSLDIWGKPVIWNIPTQNKLTKKRNFGKNKTGSRRKISKNEKTLHPRNKNRRL